MRTLFIAVLQRAVVDAQYVGRNAESVFEKDRAHNWIIDGGAQFQTVCMYAGVNHEWFREQYIAGNMKKRTPRGRQAQQMLTSRAA
ncbi:MAG: hypothetical protein OEM91_16175 [Hyphomicrobiales bacterium]|nr:hypothetical protein [Hyphomicrobiales bacterium]